MRQFEVIGDCLPVGYEDVVDAALALFANREGTIRLTLQEMNLAEREDPHAAQLGKELDGIDLVVFACEDVLSEAAVFDDPVRLAHHEGTRRHEL